MLLLHVDVWQVLRCSCVKLSNGPTNNRQQNPTGWGWGGGVVFPELAPARLQAVHVDAFLIFALPVQDVKLGPARTWIWSGKHWVLRSRQESKG